MILILDNTVVLNCIDRCRSTDLIGLLAIYPFDLHIVKTVDSEYRRCSVKNAAKKNLALYHHHINKTIQIIDDSKFPYTHFTKLAGLDQGELLSAIYKLEAKEETVLCTDDGATHNRFLKAFGKECLWTSDLLILMYQRQSGRLLTEGEIYKYYSEMKANGFIGVDNSELNPRKTFNWTEYI